MRRLNGWNGWGAYFRAASPRTFSPIAMIDAAVLVRPGADDCAESAPTVGTAAAAIRSAKPPRGLEPSALQAFSEAFAALTPMLVSNASTHAWRTLPMATPWAMMAAQRARSRRTAPRADLALRPS